MPDDGCRRPQVARWYIQIPVLRQDRIEVGPSDGVVLRPRDGRRLALWHVSGSGWASDKSGALASRIARSAASRPWCAAKSLKSLAPLGRSAPKSGIAMRPPTARAASVALVRPGLPAVPMSSCGDDDGRRRILRVERFSQRGSDCPRRMRPRSRIRGASKMLVPCRLPLRHHDLVLSAVNQMIGADLARGL
jgi:hypothetical protein